MRNSLARIVLGLAVVGGLATLWVIPSSANATQVPGTVATPGMTEARVWVNNRRVDESIPVNITVDSKAPPLPVSVSTPVDIRTLRQAWEYRDVTFSSSQTISAGLNQLGTEGWEAAGMTTLPNGNVTVLLKRPR